MTITDIGYRIIDGVDALGTQVSDTVFGAPIRLGVTGLARSGKTVFITSLIAKDSVDPNAMLSRYEGEVIAVLDKQAQKEIERAARQVATVRAMVPIPWIDMLAAFGTNITMIRRIGEI